MKAAMFKVSKSEHDFERTVQMVQENALRVCVSNCSSTIGKKG
jgi:hypothetical protein